MLAQRTFVRYTMLMLFLWVLMIVPWTGAQEGSQPIQIRNFMLSSSGFNVHRPSAVLRSTLGQATAIGISQNDGITLYAGFQAATLDQFGSATSYGGDVDGDGDVDVLDVLFVINHILHLTSLSGDALLAADCNWDGQINVLDVIGIINVILGIGTCVK